MANGRSDYARRARRALLAGALTFGIFTLAGGFCVERYLPDARDPEFAGKLSRLRARLREAPGAPLVLMMGSSRVSLGFRAGDVHVRKDQSPALVFNFGISGGGPLVELLALRRLLAEGIRPDLLLVEVLPPAFNHAGKRSLEEIWLQGGRMRFAEAVELGHYHGDPGRLVRRWLRARLKPWGNLYHVAQSHLTGEGPDDPTPDRGPAPEVVDGYGWEPHFIYGIRPEQRLHYLEVARAQYHDSMGEYQPSESTVSALEAFLAVCRQNHIAVALVLMPEGPQFASFYPPGLRESLCGQACEICKAHGLPLVDARDWLPEEGFWDSHHQLPTGAAQFTSRLVRDALEPILQSLPRREVAQAALGRP